MTRSLLIGGMAGVILSVLPSCGKDPVPCDGDSLMDTPYSCPDRASLGFGQEFGTATIIGTRPVESLVIQNGGVETLKVSEASYSGDSAFRVTFEPEAPASIEGNKRLFVQVEFAPEKAQAYSGVVTIVSNAANAEGGAQTFRVSGCGIPPDSNTACTSDADCSGANQKCAVRGVTDGGLSGVCVGVSPCYRDGGIAP